jgi:hypothetical protein
VYENIDKELLTFVEDVLLGGAATRPSASCAAETIEAKCKPCAVRKKGGVPALVLPDKVWDSQATGRQIVLIFFYVFVCLFA